MNLNSFQKWASDYARAFGFTVAPCGNWVTLHKDGASVECMSAKGVQLVCYGPGARLKVWSLVIDSDSGTECHIFTSEAERDARCSMLMAVAWGDRTEPLPADWRDAWEELDAGDCGFWISLDDHDLALPSVFA